jgi:dihydrodipicolinate synthase/N-acetylneuraminate lyase
MKQELVRVNEARAKLRGPYVTLPTPFTDEPGLPVDHGALRRYVRHVLDGGIRTGSGVVLAGGAAGDFSTMTFQERTAVARTVIEETAGAAPVAVGAQTSSTLELVKLAKMAESLGATFIQVSPPFYFAHTPEDFIEHVRAAAAESSIAMIIYNTFWTSQDVSTELLDQLADIDSVVGVKWSTADLGFMEFEQAITRLRDRYAIIDNQMRFVTSHMLGATAIELHVCTYWPEWGLQLWDLLKRGEYVQAQLELVRVGMPFMALWQEMELRTSGDGYLDKLCMELVGLPSSRCRPPTRDLRSEFREKAKTMLLAAGAPVLGEPRASESPGGSREASR